MNLSCLLGRHSAVPSHVRNLGLRFSQCRCCGSDMIHFRGSWKTAPKGFRIVWRRVDEIIAEAVPRKLIRNLPVLHAGACQNSVQDLIRRAFEMGDLVGSGLKVAGWAITERYRALRELVLPLHAFHAVTRLVPGQVEQGTSLVSLVYRAFRAARMSGPPCFSMAA
jgi:hypothetical protein